MRDDLEREPSSEAEQFEALVRRVEPRLRQALVGLCGDADAHDAVADALLWAWQNRSRTLRMDNPAGYLYRVARSRVSRIRRRRPRFQVGSDNELPEVEPGLVPALADLSEHQRVAVFLIEGCRWTHREVGELLGVSTSTASTHHARGMNKLRAALGGGSS